MPVISAAHFDRFVNFPRHHQRHYGHKAAPPHPPPRHHYQRPHRPLPHQPHQPHQSHRGLRYIAPGAGSDNGVSLTLLRGGGGGENGGAVKGKGHVRLVTSYPNPTSLPNVAGNNPFAATTAKHHHHHQKNPFVRQVRCYLTHLQLLFLPKTFHFPQKNDIPSSSSPPTKSKDPFKRPFRHVKHVLPFSASHSNDAILLTSGSAPVVFQVR